MKFKNFRDFKIIRTCNKSYKTYESYRSYLKNDFSNRCAYCNLHENQITTSFEIDHFIPRDIFKVIRPDLETDYKNLVFSCKKCNDAKSNKFAGDINSADPQNSQFYDPVLINYNDIFFRTEIGAIDSNDEKGRQMIVDLQLYRPIHNLAWICEESSKVLDKINAKILEESNTQKKIILGQAKERISDYYIVCKNIFISNYNNKKFDLKAYVEPSLVFEADKLT
ncbi:MAG: HNH endonuclease signature motif containing protein [Oscillospiraceae bacterium]